MPIATDGCHDGDGDNVSDEPRDFTGIVRDVCPTGTSKTLPHSARGCDCNQVRAIVNGTLTIDEAATGVDLPRACPKTATYRNHGAYVSCVSRMLEELREHSVVRYACAEEIEEEAAQSDIGR